LRKVASSAIGKNSALARTLYQTGEIWPFERKNMSSFLPSIEKFSAEYRSLLK
jgi:hypothetical protein